MMAWEFFAPKLEGVEWMMLGYTGAQPRPRITSPARALQSPEARRVKVVQLLCCLPGVGELRAHRIMVELGIAENRRVGGLGPNQVKALSALGVE